MLISTYASSSLHEQSTVFSPQEKIRQLEIEISRLQKMLSATPMKLVCIPQGNRQVRVKVEHILFIRSESNYSRVFLKNGEVFFTSKTLKAWEGELRDASFLRCHRSYLVNQAEIIELQRKGQEILLSCGEVIPTSRRHRILSRHALVQGKCKSGRQVIDETKGSVCKLMSMPAIKHN